THILASASSRPRRPHSSTLFPYTTLFRSQPSSEANEQTRVKVKCGDLEIDKNDRRVFWHHREVNITMKEYDILLLFAKYRIPSRSEEHTSELQSRFDLVCRLLLEKKNQIH